jgi:hypothetical protein
VIARPNNAGRSRVQPRAEPWRVVRCGPEFKLKGRCLPGYPAVVDGAGATHRGVSAYLEERATFLNVAIGSLVDDAFVLVDWLNELALVGVAWDEADDERIVVWARRQQDDQISIRRISHKVNVVYSFYAICQFILGVVDRVLGDRLDEGTSHI